MIENTNAEVFKSFGELMSFIDNAKRTHFARPIPVQEADAKLDIKSRSSKVRVFKHIHQNSVAAGIELRIANILKLIHSVDAYITSKNGANPIGMICIARYLLELAAFMTHIEFELRRAKESNKDDWVTRGKTYYGVMQRAKLGAQYRDVKEYIKQKAGLSNKELEPYRIGQCLNSLAEIPGFEKCHEEDYAFLCDVVHHNGLSHATVSEDVLAASKTPRGYFNGLTLAPVPFTSTIYQIPLQKGIDLLSGKLDPIVLRYSGRAVHANNALEPTTPFTSEELQRWTGSHDGLSILPRESIERRVNGIVRVGRNELCPCGSGIKFKFCCLAKDSGMA